MCYICLSPSPKPVCNSCLSRISPEEITSKRPELKRYYKSVFSCSGYHTLKPLIRRAKFHRELSMIPYLTQILLKGFLLLKDHINTKLIITWIPHNPREEKRINLSKELAESLSEKTGIPLAKLLEKVKPTERQASLPLKKRLINLKGAFALSTEGTILANNQDLGILIIDDVLTTGATLLEAGSTLSKTKKPLFALTLAFSSFS